MGVGCVHRVLGMQYQVLLHTHAWSTPSIPLYPPGINYSIDMYGLYFIVIHINRVNTLGLVEKDINTRHEYQGWNVVTVIPWPW